MNYNHFSKLSCYEEFEIQATLAGISKVDILKEIGYKIDNYYFFIFNDGIFNWFDFEGNHIDDPGILKEIEQEHIPLSISKCIIPDSVTSIGNQAFSFCKSLISTTISDNVTSIDDGAFFCCYSLTSITISDNITIIGNYAFCNCKSLKEIAIPNSVINIGDKTFWLCESLKQVIFKGKTLAEVKQMENYPFGIEDENVFKCS